MNTSWKNKFTKWTSARVALGRTGASLTTKQVLDFQRAHAEARNAVLKIWNFELLQKNFKDQAEDIFLVSSQTSDRENFLKFPNKGRSLSDESKNFLIQKSQNPIDVCFVISDGLSSLAIEKNFLGLWEIFKPKFQENFPELKYQIVLAPYGRVALSDEIGEALKARLSVIFIGERPGLNSADSLGIYLTFNPHKGNSDAERNCLSNIRPPEGLSYEAASLKLNYLIQESMRLQISGVRLKDECYIDETKKLS